MSKRNPLCSTVRDNPPTTASCSTTVQLRPCRCSSQAAVKPAGPAPSTTIKFQPPAWWYWQPACGRDPLRGDARLRQQRRSRNYTAGTKRAAERRGARRTSRGHGPRIPKTAGSQSASASTAGKRRGQRARPDQSSGAEAHGQPCEKRAGPLLQPRFRSAGKRRERSNSRLHGQAR